MPRLLSSLIPFPPELRGGAVAIGNFDAVHRGHASLLGQLVAQARAVGGAAVVFTFDPPPEVVLRPELARSRPLTWMQRRAGLMGKLGVDAVIAYPTDREFLMLSAEDFFRSIVLDTLAARAMVEGPNFRFGRQRGGDVALLGQLCAAAGVQLAIAEPHTTAGAMISSTRVRQLIQAGDVAAANALLLEPYRLQGTVEAGAQRGRELGFPTANLSAIPVLLPPAGVYAGRAWLAGQALPAAVHIGPNPTFDDASPKVEVHVIHWQGDLYGQQLEVELVERLRDVRKFETAIQLQQQLELDVQRCLTTTAASTQQIPFL
jgi:riboflavin kinase / FMN adenylyltransferase